MGKEISQHIEEPAGDVAMWIEQSAIHMKTLDPAGDPVELTAEEAHRVAKVLLHLAALIDLEDESAP